MRTTSTLVFVGLAVQQAAATGHGWLQADSYSCPSNTNNQCDTHEESGFKWDGLQSGNQVDKFAGYNFKGYTCQDSFGHAKRDILLSRTGKGIQSKCIAGTASKNHDSNPIISCPDKSFSIDHVQVSTEEDQDLEFTYGYSNGGTCKHVASCSKSGSTIKNTQCGGADSVTVGVPKHAPKDTCSFGIHSVGFNCGSASAPIPSSTIVPVVSTYVSPPIYTFPANSTAPSTPTAPASYPTAPISCTKGCSTIPIFSYSSPINSYPGTAPISSSVASYPTSSPISSESSFVPTTASESIPESTPSSPATYSTGSSSVPVVSESSPVYTPQSTESSPATYPVSSESSPVSSTPSESSPSSLVTYPLETPSVPASSETSVVQTYAQSTPSVPASYPAETPSVPVSSSLGNSPTEVTSSSLPGTTAGVYTTEIVYTTLTTCPVTNTITTAGTTSLETVTTVSTITGTTTSIVSVTSVPATAPEVPITSGNSPIPASSSSPAPSAPCPSVLPQCLNTWIKLTTCENNAASDCYCTNSEFTKNVQDCVSSWAYDDNEIQAALSYLAGICAPHVSANPGIVTHIPKTITLVPTPMSSYPVTPAPSGVPGVTAGPIGAGSPSTVISYSYTSSGPVTYSTGASAGQPIPSSSTISVIVTAVSVPQVKFTTGNSAAGATDSPEVGLAAGSPAPVPAAATPAPYGGGVAPGSGPTGASTFASVKQVPTAVSSPITPFTGAAAKVGSGMAGLAMAAVMSLIVLA